MKFGVIVFPGSNCDQDTLYVLRHVLRQEVVELWHKDHDLQGCDFLFLPGGFSYGDYLRSGAIARFSPIMQEVMAFAGRGGYLMGICNGFQILCEAGLLPGALLHNTSRKFICDNTYLKVQSSRSVITSRIPEDRVLKIPVAHGEGLYYADEATLQELNEHDQVLFRYCRPDGTVSASANPNGSVQHIAGICNMNRNVFGMMPHPERASDPVLGNEDGLLIFESMLESALSTA